MSDQGHANVADPTRSITVDTKLMQQHGSNEAHAFRIYVGHV